MLLHKGGQINNVQMITGVRIVEMSQLQNCSVMCAKKEVIVKIKIKKKSGGRGQERCVQRMEVIVVKRKKKVGGGGGGGGGSRKMRMKM